MDMLAVDLTHLPAAGIGSKVVLWGEGVAIETVADAAGTIGWSDVRGGAARAAGGSGAKSQSAPLSCHEMALGDVAAHCRIGER